MAAPEKKHLLEKKRRRKRLETAYYPQTIQICISYRPQTKVINNISEKYHQTTYLDKKLQKLSKKCLVISDLFLITYSRNNRMSKMIFSANYLHLLWLTSWTTNPNIPQ